MRRLVCNLKIQYIIINLHIKYDYSSLHSLTELFDEKLHYSKYGKKGNRTNTSMNKQEKAGCNPKKSSSICIPNMTFLASIGVEKSLRKSLRGADGRTDG